MTPSSKKIDSFLRKISNGDIEYCKKFLNLHDINHVNIHLKNTNIYEYVVRNSNSKIFEFLLNSGVNVNDNVYRSSMYPIHAVCYHNIAEVDSINLASMILEKGGDVNVLTDIGYSAIYFATESNKFELLKFLFENGAVVNKYSRDYSAMIQAVYNTNLPMIKYLVSMGVPVDTFDKFEMSTPLLTAFDLLCNYEKHKNIFEIIRYIMSFNPNLDMPVDIEKNTILHKLVINDNIFGIREIMKYSPNVNISNIYGQYPWDYASEYLRNGFPNLKNAI